MPVRDSFCSVEACVLSSLLKLGTTTDIFYHLFLRFQYILPPLKYQKNNIKFRIIGKISTYHLHLKINSSVDNFKEAYLNYWDIYLLYYRCYLTNNFIGNFNFLSHSNYRFSNLLLLFVQIKYLIISAIQLNNSRITNIQHTKLSL